MEHPQHLQCAFLSFISLCPGGPVLSYLSGKLRFDLYRYSNEVSEENRLRLWERNRKKMMSPLKTDVLTQSSAV